MDGFKSYIGFKTKRRPISELFKHHLSNNKNPNLFDNQTVQLIIYVRYENLLLVLTEDYSLAWNRSYTNAVYTPEESDDKKLEFQLVIDKEAFFEIHINCLFQKKRKECKNMLSFNQPINLIQKSNSFDWLPITALIAVLSTFIILITSLFYSKSLKFKINNFSEILIKKK